MKIFSINGHNAIVVDGTIYIEAPVINLPAEKAREALEEAIEDQLRINKQKYPNRKHKKRGPRGSYKKKFGASKRITRQKLSQDDKEEIIDLHYNGIGAKEISEKFNVSYWTIWNMVKKLPKVSSGRNVDSEPAEEKPEIHRFKCDNKEDTHFFNARTSDKIYPCPIPGCGHSAELQV